MRICAGVCVSVLLAGGLLGSTGQSPETSGDGADRGLSLVSKDNLLEYVRTLAGFESRHVFHSGNKKTEEYIAGQLEKCGYAPKPDAFEADGRTLNNVLAGSSDKERPVILLTAHFDSTGGPGADDNASGVATLLELARIVKEHPVQANVEFAFFNCEEGGAAGSRHLSNEYRDQHWPIDYVINVDTIGTWKGPLSDACPVNYVADPNSEEAIKRFAERFPYPLRKAKTMWRDDHARFWDNGFKAVEITEDGCTPHMHRPTDTPERLDYDNIARIVHGLYAVLSK
ncbi:MAG: M28 family metallopeptidase [Solirubrobacterales bacterium]